MHAVRPRILLVLALVPLAACEREAPAHADAAEAPAAVAPSTGGPEAPAAPVSSNPRSPSQPVASPPVSAPPHAQEPGGDPPVIRTGDREEEAPPSRGRMILDLQERDLGLVEQEIIPLHFAFSIEGEDPVVVTELRPACGCTEAHLEVEGERWPLGRPLPPGTKGELLATFDSRRFNHEKRSSVEVRGDAANLPATVRFRAIVQPTFRLAPQSLRLGRLAGGTPAVAEGRWTLRVESRRPFQIQEWTELPRGVTVTETERQPLENGGEVHVLEIRLDPDLPVGPLFGSCVASTDLGMELRFLVQGTVEGPVRFLPAGRIWFSLVDQGSGPARQFRVQSNREGFVVPRPEVSLDGDPAFAVEEAGGEEGSEYRYRIVLKADASPGPHRAMLVARFPEDSGIPPHQVPVDATVRVRQ